MNGPVLRLIWARLRLVGLISKQPHVLNGAIRQITVRDGVLEIGDGRIHAVTTVQALPSSPTAVRDDSPWVNL